VEQWVAGESFDLFVASHDGYARLPQPVTHWRSVFYLRNRFWLVRDVVVGSGTHDLEINLHLSPRLQPTATNANVLRAKISSRSVLAFVVPGEHGWQQSLESGWWSPAYGRKEQSPMLRFRRHAQLPAEFATMICAMEEMAEEPESLLRMKGSSVGDVSGYEFSTAQGSHVLIFSDNDRGWTLGPWASDANMLYCGMTREGGLQHFALVRGSFVEHDGQRVLHAEHRVTRCEALREAGGWRVSCPAGESTGVVEYPEKAN
jgi:hypothetical protein